MQPEISIHNSNQKQFYIFYQQFLDAWPNRCQVSFHQFYSINFDAWNKQKTIWITMIKTYMLTGKAFLYEQKK